MPQRPGFTLIEMLVVTAVFSMAFLIASTVFTNISTRQRTVLARQRISADSRYVLESIARTVRIGTIDYNYYTSSQCNLGGPCDLSQAQTVLALRDQTNTPTCYRLSGTQLQTATTTTDCYDIHASWSTLNSQGLDVTAFKVFLSPRSDPFLRIPRSTEDCYVQSFPYNFNASGVCTCATLGKETSTTASATGGCFADQVCVNSLDGSTKICQNADGQPQATLVISTQTSNNAVSAEQAKSTLQTTVVSRVYER